MRRIKLVTRRSHLALVHAGMPVVPLLAVRPGADDMHFSLEIITTDTSGDRGKSAQFHALVDITPSATNLKNAWFGEIDEAIANGMGDIGIHSAKDVPPEINAGTRLYPIMERDDPRDVFISRHGIPFRDLPTGACIGTSSTRRRAQLLMLRPDLTFPPEYKGNVTTRIGYETMDRRGVDGVVLAAAGVARLGRLVPQHLLDSREFFAVDDMLPCVNQAIIVAQCRREDEMVCGLIEQRLVLPDTAIVWQAERAALEAMNADCANPLALHATRNGGRLNLLGRAYSLDGRQMVEESASAALADADALGRALGARLLEKIVQKALW